MPEQNHADGEKDWREIAAELQAHGIPERRAQVVALIQTGHTHADVVDELGLESRGAVSNHVKRYREKDLPNARWLAENAPEI